MRTILLCAIALFAGLAPAAAQTADAPPFDIGGNDWICVEACAPGRTGMPVAVVQDGGRFVFINESGVAEAAEWKSDNQISFVGCDNGAILSPDHKKLSFVFGAVWVR